MSLSRSSGEEPGTSLQLEQRPTSPEGSRPPSHSVTRMLLAPCTKLHLGPAPPHHTARGTEGWRQEGQTAKAQQSAGTGSRAAPDGTAWMWALTSRCQEAPSPTLFLLPGLWGAGHNLSSHLHPRGGSSAEGWPSSSSGAALGHLAGSAEPQHWPFATPWAWRKAGGACWLFPVCWVASRLGFRPGPLPSTWNKPAVVLMSRRGVDVPPWCWQPSLVLASRGQPLCQEQLLQSCLLCGSRAWEECLCLQMTSGCCK